MFSDTNIAKSFQMGCCKFMYLVSYGVAPHFKNYLIDKFEECEAFVVLIDESISNVT